MNGSDLYKACLSKAMALCSKREYCREEIRQKLADWGAGETEIKSIMDVLLKEKFIDERRYATAFTRDKFRYNKWGKIKIAANLRMKRIPQEIISEALDAIDYDEYVQSLKDLIVIHRKSIKAKNQWELKGKLIRFALSRGFENGLIYEVLNVGEE